MRLDAAQTIHQCEEFSEVGIPIRDLLVDGNLDIFPEVATRGFFDIDYRRGTLVLRATKYVGLIPISQRVAIHVRPRAPIGNLMWLAWRTGMVIPKLDGVMRGYAVRAEEIDSPEALYVDAFLTALEGIASGQILKRYRTGEAEGALRGRLSVSRSIGRFYARGIRHRHVFEPTELTADNLENRILKHTAQRVLRFVRQSQMPGTAVRTARLGKALQPLQFVDDSQLSPREVARHAQRLIRSLPSTHSHYETALWLSYLIATNSGVSLEEFGPTRLETVVLNVSDIFEAYVRHVCAEAESSLGCSVRDGNRQTLRLFVQGAPVPIKPDIYFVREHHVLAVADAKYKPAPSEEDRYALISYCDATGAQRGAMILPADVVHPVSTHLGDTRGGKRLDIIRVNLAATDMRLEEAKFLAEIRSLLSPAPAQDHAA